MEVAIQYMVPVTVFVDTEKCQVVRVLQENENMFLPDMPEVYDESWTPITDGPTIEYAISAAEEDKEWPVWDRA